MLIIVNILAIINFILYIASNWQSQKQTIFKLLIACNIVSVTEYLILGTTTGAILCTLCIIQYILFNKWHNKIVLSIMCTSFLTLGLIYADSIITAALYLVVIIRCILLYCKNPQRTRESGVVQNTIYPIYDIYYGTILLVAIDIIKLINDTLATWKYGKHTYKRKIKQAKTLILQTLN